MKMPANLAYIETDNTDSSNKLCLQDAVEICLRAYMFAHDDVLPVPNLHKYIIREVERPLFQIVMEYAGGNKIKAASILGINRNTLSKKLIELGLHCVSQNS